MFIQLPKTPAFGYKNKTKVAINVDNIDYIEKADNGVKVVINGTVEYFDIEFDILIDDISKLK